MWPNSMLALSRRQATVRLWDTEVGRCAHVLRKHDKKVYTIAFSPSGQYLASGSLGGQLNIWRALASVKESKAWRVFCHILSLSLSLSYIQGLEVFHTVSFDLDTTDQSF